MAFLQANVRLGILGRERFHYWGLLLWTFFRRPRLSRWPSPLHLRPPLPQDVPRWKGEPA